MYIKTKDTKFGIGQINDDIVLMGANEFDAVNSIKKTEINIPTYIDDSSGLVLYLYDNKLVTIKELRREWAKDYYEVD